MTPHSKLVTVSRYTRSARRGGGGEAEAEAAAGLPFLLLLAEARRCPVPWNVACASAQLAAVRYGSGSVSARAWPFPNSGGCGESSTPRRGGPTEPVWSPNDATSAGGLPRLFYDEPRPVRGSLRAATSAGVGRSRLQPSRERILHRPAQHAC